MTPPTSASTRIKAWLKVYTTNGEDFPNDRLPCSFLDAPLYLSDIQSLVDASDRPSDACNCSHPSHCPVHRGVA